MQHGYTWIQVDLRGFGGSTGCLDWGGPGEQADVVAAVQWAAQQPWSNGNVGMYGKSYDGVTGLIGVNKRPQGLKAVVAQEPVYDLYRYLYGDGMRRTNSVLTPALYDAIEASPGPLGTSRRTRSTTSTARTTPAPRLQAAQLGRPGRQRRPLLAVLARAQPDPGGEGLEGPAVPHPGPDREQHRRRRHEPVHRRTTRATSARGSARGSTSAAPRRTRRAAC